MTAALLFPQFAPNLYDLAIMLKSDMVILQDNEPWSRKSRTHRAKIRTPQGTQWINIPVVTGDREKPIKDVHIDHQRDWIGPFLKSVEYNYRNSLYYDFYEPEINADFRSAIEHELLITFIEFIRMRLFRFLDVNIEIRYASNIENYSSDPDRLAENLGFDTLYQECDSRHYQRQAVMKSKPGFIHPKYHQHFEGFEAHCCILDLLFQMGPESFRIIDRIR